MRFAFAALLALAVTTFTVTRDAIPAPQPFVVSDHGADGDSLKVVVVWKNPVDSATVGLADSTLYTVRLSKAGAWWGGSPIAANTDVNRRRVGSMTADSLKLLLPVVGDSVTIQVKNFRQCRKNDCSIAGSAAALFKRSFAPPPTSPTLRVTTF